jgi:hypothetical protein
MKGVAELAEEQANAVPNEDEELELEMVEETFQVKGGGIRNKPAGVTTKSGYTKLNSEGSEKLDKVAGGNGFKPGEYTVTFGVDAKRGVVAAKTVRLGTPNAMPVRRSADRSLSIHLGGVFLKHPELRPVTTSECAVAIRKDAMGDTCLMIALKTGQAKSKGRNRTTAQAPKSQPNKDGTAG